MARLAAIVVVAALAAMPATALAAPQPNPFLPQPAPQEEQPSTPAPQPAPAPSAQQDTGAISGGTVLLIGLGIAGLIGGIWYVIARDARRATAGRLRDPLAVPQGRSATRASPRSRRLSQAERKRRKRGRAR